jgi:hypothetical protein
VGPNYRENSVDIPDMYRGTTPGKNSFRRSPVGRSGNVVKRNSLRIAIAVLAAMASLVIGPNLASAAAAKHLDQVPGSTD